MVNWHLRDSKFRRETILKEITIFQTADKHGSSYPNQGKIPQEIYTYPISGHVGQKSTKIPNRIL